MDLDEYSRPGPMTQLTTPQLRLLDAVEPTPVELCRAAQGLIMLPELAMAAGVDQPRAEERNIRPASAIVRRALELDAAPLTSERAVDQRVLGTCRHFAVLSCAFLRAREIPARARCGFETYFQPGRNNDHWITEYWDGGRWVRIDSEILGFNVVDRPEDLADGQFLTGDEAWSAYRAGADPMTFGVHGTDNWGAAEVVGNAIRDLAALNKVEMLPWDEWGPMSDCYSHGLTPEIESLMDDVSAAVHRGDDVAIADHYNRLAVPSSLAT